MIGEAGLQVAVVRAVREQGGGRERTRGGGTHNAMGDAVATAASASARTVVRRMVCTVRAYVRGA